MHWITVLLILVITAFAFFLLRRQGLISGFVPIVSSALLLILTFGTRLYVLDTTTLDYEWFLSPWVQHFRDHGGFLGLAIPMGNYNVTYLYFLALFSYIPLPDLHLIKLLSFFFDVILAYYVMRIVGLSTKSAARKRIAFFLVLLLPTVFLNSAYWGQCESIYSAFTVMSFYYVLKDRPILSLAALAVALSFKLQAVFLFPLYLIFLYRKKIRRRHLPVFPGVYLLTILPAVIAGRPFWDTLLFYIHRGGNDGLNYNSPSIFAWNQGTNYNPTLAAIGIIAAFGLVGLVYLLVFIRRRTKTRLTEDYLILALIFVVGVPLFLPHMHDRYFYLADLFAIALGLSRIRFIFAIPLTQFASLLGYGIYLRHWATPPLLLPFFGTSPMRYGTIALLILLVSLMVDFFFRRKKAKNYPAIK